MASTKSNVSTKESRAARYEMEWEADGDFNEPQDGDFRCVTLDGALALIRTMRWIDANPREHNQAQWAHRARTADDQPELIIPGGADPVCGTSCCMAGTGLVQSGYTLVFRKGSVGGLFLKPGETDTPWPEWVDEAIHAADVFGLPLEYNHWRLFGGDLTVETLRREVTMLTGGLYSGPDVETSEYNVSWAANIKATSPEQAAGYARDLIANPGDGSVLIVSDPVRRETSSHRIYGE